MSTPESRQQMWNNANRVGRIEKGFRKIFGSQVALIVYAATLLLIAAWMEGHVGV